MRYSPFVVESDRITRNAGCRAAAVCTKRALVKMRYLPVTRVPHCFL